VSTGWDRAGSDRLGGRFSCGRNNAPKGADLNRDAVESGARPPTSYTCQSEICFHQLLRLRACRTTVKQYPQRTDSRNHDQRARDERRTIREKLMNKNKTLLELAWQILQQGDTVLLLSLICLLDRNKEIAWPEPTQQEGNSSPALPRRQMAR
jgi:hypothetical protein